MAPVAGRRCRRPPPGLDAANPSGPGLRRIRSPPLWWDPNGPRIRFGPSFAGSAGTVSTAVPTSRTGPYRHTAPPRSGSANHTPVPGRRKAPPGDDRGPNDHFDRHRSGAREPAPGLGPRSFVGVDGTRTPGRTGGPSSLGAIGTGRSDVRSRPSNDNTDLGAAPAGHRRTGARHSHNTGGPGPDERNRCRGPSHPAGAGTPPGPIPTPEPDGHHRHTFTGHIGFRIGTAPRTDPTAGTALSRFRRTGTARVSSPTIDRWESPGEPLRQRNPRHPFR